MVVEFQILLQIILNQVDSMQLINNFDIKKKQIIQIDVQEKNMAKYEHFLNNEIKELIEISKFIYE